MHPNLRMLVTACAPVPGPNAHDSALRLLATSLPVQIDAVTLKVPGLPHVGHHRGTQMFRVPVKGDTESLRTAEFARAVGRQLDSATYDVVHVRGAAEGAEVATRKAGGGFAMVYELGTFPAASAGAAAIGRWRESHLRAAESADLVLVPSPAALRQMESLRFGDKTLVLPPTIDSSSFDWWPNTDAPSGPKRIVFLGHFAPTPEFSLFVNTAVEIAKRGNLEFLFLGEGPSEARKALREALSTGGAEATVRPIPSRSTLARMVAAADACVVSAASLGAFPEWGGVPEGLLVPLACRVATVVQAAPGITSLLEPGLEVVTFAAGDKTALVGALTSLLADQAKRNAIAEAGFLRARANFSEGTGRRALAEAYTQLFSSDAHSPHREKFDAWLKLHPWDSEFQLSASARSTPESSSGDVAPALDVSTGAFERFTDSETHTDISPGGVPDIPAPSSPAEHKGPITDEITQPRAPHES